MRRLGDEADQANRLCQAELDAMISAVRAAASAPPMAFTGGCRSCGEPVSYPKRFCDSACSGEWERRMRYHR